MASLAVWYDAEPLTAADPFTPTDKVMGDLTSAYWAQFGKTGDPNGGGRPEWPRYDSAVDRTMHFTNSGIIIGTDPLKSRLDCFDCFFYNARPA